MPTNPSQPSDDSPDSDVLDKQFALHTLRGALATTIAQLVKLVLRVGSTALLARLLSPADFGLLAMAAAIAGVASMLRDWGLSSATVQWPRLSEEAKSTIFWLGMGTNILAATAVALSGSLVAMLYRDPRLEGLCWALSLPVLVGGLGLQHQALLRRELRFPILAGLEVASVLFGVAAALGGALAGLAYNALVLQQLVAAATLSIGCWLALSWRPALVWSKKEAVRAMQFGGGVLGFQALNYFSRNLDDALVGWRWGAAAAGEYNRAYALFLAPLSEVSAPIAAVAVPTLSRLQSRPTEFCSFYCGALKLVSAGTLPIAAASIVFADVIVYSLLGPHWGHAAGVLRALGVAAMLQPIGNSLGWIYLSLGRTRNFLHWGLVSAPVICTALVAGLPYGPEGVASGFSIATLLLIIPGLIFATRGTPIGIHDIWRASRGPLLISVVGAGLAGVVRVIGGEGAATLGLALVAFGLVTIGAAFLSLDLRRLVKQLRGALRA